VNSLFLFLAELGSVAPSNALILNVLVETNMQCVYVWRSTVWPIYTLSRTYESYWLR